MRGSIKKHIGKRGITWYAVVDVGSDPATGKRRQKRISAPTERQCEKLLAGLISTTHLGTAIVGNNATMREFVERWLEASEANLKPATVRRYRDLMRLHVLPVIGGTQLQKLSAVHIQNLHRHWRKKGLAPTSCYHAHYIVNRALQQAFKWGVVAANPCQLVDAPRRGTPEMKTWDARQVEAVFTAARGDDLEALWRLALLTGMRRGEILGLKWEDLDLERGVLAVRRTRSRGQGNNWELGTPKSASGRRSITLPVSVIDSLKRHRVCQLSQRLALGAVWEDSGFVFTNGLGRPLHVNSLMHRFGKLIEAAGVPRIRFHDLRHTSATILLAQRIHPKIVQERLGHSSISMTLDRYSHVTRDMQQAAADALDAVFEPEAQAAS